MKTGKFFRGKKLWILFILGVLILWTNAAIAATLLKYGHANVPIYFYHTAGEAFSQCLEKSTDGAVKVKIYPQGQLGGERDITEGLQLGSVDFQATSIGVTGTFIPALRILNLPFVFKGPKHWMAVMNGSVGQLILGKAREQGEQVGLKVLAIGAPDFRLPMNNKRPITSMEDFKGLKIRTMQVPLHMKAYENIGASPVPLPFGELYTALQTGVVDGNENGPLTLYGKKFYEVQKYMVLLPVVSNGGIFLMSKATWDKLSREQQLAVTKCIPVWRKKMDQDALEKGGWAIEKMKEQGLQVDTIADVKPFIEATKPAYEWLYNDLPKDTAEWTREMVAKIREVGAGIEKEEWYVTK
ncbi:MAG: DctP family TRAP transporter solute-binding subunit [Proteobacteria bacterium]|nr:DctP family TRAP transporter solute-binding subunit [Pseudomonadota bacterium]NIS70207.1 DctP family TRAP transporter solute-binding subunit [Pseudomonadota bacterium]